MDGISDGWTVDSMLVSVTSRHPVGRASLCVGSVSSHLTIGTSVTAGKYLGNHLFCFLRNEICI